MPGRLWRLRRSLRQDRGGGPGAGSLNSDQVARGSSSLLAVDLEHGLALDDAGVRGQPRLPTVVAARTVSPATSWITTLSPGPPSRMSLPGPPISTSSPAPPRRVSLPSPPMSTSSPSPPSAVSSVASAARPEASTTSSPASALTVSRSLPAIAPVIATRGGQAGDAARCVPAPATTTTSSPLVALTMTLSAAPSSPPPVGRRGRPHVGDVGAGQVVDGERCRRRRGP